MTFIIYQFFRNNCTSWLFKCAIKENVTNKLNLVLTHFIHTHTHTMRAIRWGRWEENTSRNRQHYQTNAKNPGNTFYVVSLLSFFPLRLSELYLSESEFYLLRLDCPRQLFILWQRSKLKINIFYVARATHKIGMTKICLALMKIVCRAEWFVGEREHNAHTHRQTQAHMDVHVYLWCRNKCTCRTRTYQPNKIKPKWKHAWFHSHNTDAASDKGKKKKLSSNFQFQPHTVV